MTFSMQMKVLLHLKSTGIKIVQQQQDQPSVNGHQEHGHLQVQVPAGPEGPRGAAGPRGPRGPGRRGPVVPLGVDDGARDGERAGLGWPGASG